MNAIKQYAPPRTRERIYAEIQEQRAIVDQYRKLAAEFYALDCLPMIFDGTSVQRIGPDPVPQELLNVLQNESDRFAQLEHELYLASHGNR